MSFESCFTAPSFRTFCGLVAGSIAQTGRRTVCGMLLGAGLSRLWPHDRAHYFFARARWCPQRLGLRLARLVVVTLLPEDTPVLVVVDDTLFKRRGKKVWAAGWFHDGSAAGPKPSGYGNNWVVAGIVVPLPFSARPVCLPVLARLVVKNSMANNSMANNSMVTDSPSASRRDLARAMIETLAAALPGRTVHGVGDAAYSGKGLTGLDEGITWTTRLRADAALHHLTPPRTGRR
ncbi:MAG: transposase, partial [Stackebrandtia sp.]